MNTTWKDASVAKDFLERRGGLPLASEQLDLMLFLAGRIGRTPRNILDLGCGDGLVGSALLEAFAGSCGDFVDFSTAMLDRARQRLAKFANVRLFEADLERQALPAFLGDARYDCVVSGYALHHLTDPRKREIYREIFSVLRPGGVFINMEHVASPSRRIELLWEESVVRGLFEFQRKGDPAADPHVVRKAYLERRDADANILAPVELQCTWLREIGFTDVDVFFKYFELAVFGGFKPEGAPCDEDEGAGSGANQLVIRVMHADEATDVAAVLQEAAAWLTAKGEPLWKADELNVDAIAADVRAGLYWGVEVNGQIVGVVRFQLEDPLFWPDVPAGEAAYVHRLAVRRAHAGGKVSSALLKWAVQEAKARGRRCLRLDTDAARPKLRAIYERFGFQLHSCRQVGPYYVARYQLQLDLEEERMESRRFRLRSEHLDSSKVAALRTQALLTDPDAFGEQHVMAAARSGKEWAEWLAERANGADRQIFALVDEERYVGMCGVGIDRDTGRSGFIWGVYVRPECRGQGGADLLLSGAHEWLKARGIRRVNAKVATPNDVAIRFYRRMGYTILGQDGTLREGSLIPVYTIAIDLPAVSPLAADDAGGAPCAFAGWAVRRYVAADEAGVIALWKECALIVPWNDPRKDIARKMARQPELFLVGTLDGVVAAAVMAGYDGHRGWINYLGVRPALRGRGFGRAIMAEAEARLRALGCPKISLQIRASNRKVVAFYKQIGFSQDAVYSMGKRLERDDV